jgi:hypothetical protein
MASAGEQRLHSDEDTRKEDVEHRGGVARVQKGRWEALWPVIACGAGLFSDGYLNNVRLFFARKPECQRRYDAHCDL